MHDLRFTSTHTHTRDSHRFVGVRFACTDREPSDKIRQCIHRRECITAIDSHTPSINMEYIISTTSRSMCIRASVLWAQQQQQQAAVKWTHKVASKKREINISYGRRKRKEKKKNSSTTTNKMFQVELATQWVRHDSSNNGHSSATAPSHK